MTFAPPSSQAAGDRPITFILADGVGAGPPVEPVTLSIRPESLTRQDPSRLSVQQTLGGAWADSFGSGLATINIQGHTGWRRNVGLSQDSAAEDGEARFLRLKDTIFSQWHQRRALATQSGLNPDAIQLVFADALDSFAAIVAPQSFVLQRSRSRPLLMQYQISMIVLSEEVGAPVGISAVSALTGDVLRTVGLDSLADSLDRLESYAKSISGIIDSSIAGPAQKFMQTTAAIYRRVDTAVRSADGVAASLISVAQTTARAGMNIFRSLNLIVGLPQRARALLTQIATAYTNVWCLFRNAIKTLPEYEDYSTLYGASNCSSTSGGRALSTFAGSNTLSAVAPVTSSAVRVTPAAQVSLQSMARADVVLAPPSRTTVSSSLNTINLGLEVV